MSINMKLKSKSLRKLEKVKNAIRAILWQSAWASHKQDAGVSGQEAAIEFWNESFIPEWERSDYYQCDKLDVLESLLAESEMSIADVLEEHQEIMQRKSDYNDNQQSKLAAPGNMPGGMRSVNGYEYDNENNAAEGYDPLY